MKISVPVALLASLAFCTQPLLAAPATPSNINACTVYDVVEYGAYPTLSTVSKGHQVITDNANHSAKLMCNGPVLLPEHGLTSGPVEFNAYDNPVVSYSSSVTEVPCYLFMRDKDGNIIDQDGDTLTVEYDADGNVTWYDTDDVIAQTLNWTMKVAPSSRAHLICEFAEDDYINGFVEYTE